MKTTLSKPLVLLASLLCTVAIAQAQEPTPPELPVLPPPSTWEAPALEPFTATYQALYKGKEAGDATGENNDRS